MSGRHRDLCWTCNHRPTCVNRGTAERPVFYCEEFDAYIPVSQVSLGSASPAGSNGKKRSGQYEGLCCNCENRETCTIRDPEGGVWHCEEYR